MKYRTDYSEITGTQVIHYVRSTLAKVEGVPCPDGKKRTAFISGEADTAYTIPAYVHNKSRKVSGYLTRENGIYRFNSLKIAPWEVLPKCENKRVAVGDLVFYGTFNFLRERRSIGRVTGFADRDGVGNIYPMPKLRVLQMSENFMYVYTLHIDQDTVTNVRRPAQDQGAFAAWFFGGPLAPAEELAITERHGSLSENYFRDNCTADGGRKNRE